MATTMNGSHNGSLLSAAATVPVPYFTLLRTSFHFVSNMLYHDNPLLWNYLFGKKNVQSDVEGPFYVLDSPSRNISDGMGVLASHELLKKFKPFLLHLQILTPDGDPIPNATLDLWHADSSGNYSFLSYTLRGKIVTDSKGRADVLSIAPGMYGVFKATRAGHFHVIVHPTRTEDGKEWDELTTQIYICEGNSKNIIENDFVNKLWRDAKTGNLAYSYSAPSQDTEPIATFMNFPVLADDDSETAARIELWNKLLSQTDPELRIHGGANYQIKLNAKPSSGWF